jgi:alkanesulfonate monooxygenase
VGLAVISNDLAGVDLTGYDIDGPLPVEVVPQTTNASKSTLPSILQMAQRENLTIRQLYLRYCGARGQRTIVGNAEDVADEMEEWFVNYGVDGFLVHPAYMPGGLSDFVDLVVPELQRRGLFRIDYEGRTLRENLGLTRPENQFCSRSKAKNYATPA